MPIHTLILIIAGCIAVKILASAIQRCRCPLCALMRSGRCSPKRWPNRTRLHTVMQSVMDSFCATRKMRGAGSGIGAG